MERYCQNNYSSEYDKYDCELNDKGRLLMKRIMIIDDDEQFRTMLKKMLEQNGYTTVEAANGERAMKEMERNPADIMIVDIIMPVMDGLETIIHMQREYPFVKLIAISGGGRIEPQNYLNSAEKLGAVCSFTKPIDNQELLSAIEELLTDLHH
jgi:CheY-like chemotaxis protein